MPVDTTLTAIRNNVRELIRAPNQSQMSDVTLDNHINYVLTYNLPANLRLFDLRSTFKFYTQPNIETYETVTTAGDILENFRNKFRAIHPPIYIGGSTVAYTEKRDLFFGWYPQQMSIRDTLLRGNGATGPFAGTLPSIPVMQNHVNFNCLDAAGTAMILIDTPTNNVTGTLDIFGVPPGTSGSTINYITGAFTLNFPNNTQNGAIIYSATLPYTAGQPVSMLYYDDKFVLRPVPDKVYEVSLEVEARPTELINNGDIPYIEQWTDYISFMAAKRIFSFRSDDESIAKLMPLLKEEEFKVLRPTLERATNEKTTTIYDAPQRYRWGGFWGPGPL